MEYKVGANPCPPHGNTKEPLQVVGTTLDGSVVLSYFRDVKSANSKHMTWFLNVQCKCGRSFVVQKNKFYSGKTHCKICSKVPDLTGKVFNSLTVLSLEKVENGNSFWKCSCICGNFTTVRARSLPKTISCGCAVKLLTSEDTTTHGLSGTREYTIWSGMKDRASNPRNSRHADYTSRGITIEDDRWLQFENFILDMGKAPSELHSLDRIDNNKGYCKENCRWVTASVQMSNRRVSSNTSGRIGVSFCKQTSKWKARFRYNKVEIWIGRFSTYEEACEAVEEAELTYLGFSRKEGFIKWQVL